MTSLARLVFICNNVNDIKCYEEYICHTSSWYKTKCSKKNHFGMKKDILYWKNQPIWFEKKISHFSSQSTWQIPGQFKTLSQKQRQNNKKQTKPQVMVEERYLILSSGFSIYENTWGHTHTQSMKLSELGLPCLSWAKWLLVSPPVVPPTLLKKESYRINRANVLIPTDGEGASQRRGARVGQQLSSFLFTWTEQKAFNCELYRKVRARPVGGVGSGYQCLLPA